MSAFAAALVSLASVNVVHIHTSMAFYYWCQLLFRIQTDTKRAHGKGAHRSALFTGHNMSCSEFPVRLKPKLNHSPQYQNRNNLCTHLPSRLCVWSFYSWHLVLICFTFSYLGIFYRFH